MKDRFISAAKNPPLRFISKENSRYVIIFEKIFVNFFTNQNLDISLYRDKSGNSYPESTNSKVYEFDISCKDCHSSERYGTTELTRSCRICSRSSAHVSKRYETTCCASKSLVLCRSPLNKHQF